MARKQSQAFVGSDHEITEEEALKMGYALFDAIASDQAKQARKAAKQPKK